MEVIYCLQTFCYFTGTLQNCQSSGELCSSEGLKFFFYRALVSSSH
jgi:hypothetical protein